jgi:hypothetical protein
MLFLLAALKPEVDSVTKEYFTTTTEEEQGYPIALVVIYIIIRVILFIIFAYGAARLSYYYNVSTGNSGSATFWPILAFFGSEFYYPYYAYALNPLSAKRRNNIAIV